MLCVRSWFIILLLLLTNNPFNTQYFDIKWCIDTNKYPSMNTLYVCVCVLFKLEIELNCHIKHWFQNRNKLVINYNTDINIKFMKMASSIYSIFGWDHQKHNGDWQKKKTKRNKQTCGIVKQKQKKKTNPVSYRKWCFLKSRSILIETETV